MKHTVIGMDIAKHVFQLHTVDRQTGEIERLKLRRSQVREFFARRASSVVALEACGSAHYWGRELRALGHEVRLLAPKSVRPFVRSNKDDAADAQAIWTAVQQPGAHLVALKSEAQQAILMLHRMRAQLLKFRVMQTNALRGFLYEYGVVLPQGHRALAQAWPTALARLAEQLPGMVLESLREQWARVQRLEEQIAALERRLASALRANEQCAQIAAIPGVGLLTATAAVAAIGEARTFKSARQFAAWVGLVPRHVGTGGRVRHLGLSKRGDTYLRTLLIHGARSLIARGKHSPWIAALLKRRPYSVVVAALANKLARTIWAVLARGKPYNPAAFSAA